MTEFKLRAGSEVKEFKLFETWNGSPTQVTNVCSTHPEQLEPHKGSETAFDAGSVWVSFQAAGSSYVGVVQFRNQNSIWKVDYWVNRNLNDGEGKVIEKRVQDWKKD